MVDRPPPSRFSVVERGGRLVVIDRASGTTPPTAAERMAEHDRRMGNEPALPAPPQAVTETRVVPKSQAERESDEAKRRSAAPLAGRERQPWGDARRPEPEPSPAPARIAARAQPASGGARKRIVTAKWWDAKGPRTIELGPNGQAELSGGFLAFLFMTVAVAIVVGFLSLPLLFIGGFLLLRFAGKLIGPVGASLVDKALAARD